MRAPKRREPSVHRRQCCLTAAYVHGQPPMDRLCHTSHWHLKTRHFGARCERTTCSTASSAVEPPETQTTRRSAEVPPSNTLSQPSSPKNRLGVTESQVVHVATRGAADVPVYLDHNVTNTLLLTCLWHLYVLCYSLAHFEIGVFQCRACPKRHRVRLAREDLGL